MILHLKSICFILCLLVWSTFSESSSSRDDGSTPMDTLPDCGFEPRPTEGKFWVMQLKTEFFDDANDDCDMHHYAHWLTKEHAFRVLKSYKFFRGFYLVELEKFDVRMGLKKTNYTEHEKCQFQLATITIVEKYIRQNPHVVFFHHKPVPVTFIDFNLRQPRDFIINPSIQNQNDLEEDWDKLLAPIEIKFVHTAEEKMKCIGSCVDVIDVKRPENLPEPVSEGLRIRLVGPDVPLKSIFFRIINSTHIYAEVK